MSSSVAGLPVVIASSVIRSSHQGESHGGVYLVNLETEAFRRVMDWNDCNIDWEGRGADRGLRGIAVDERAGLVYLAASDELFVYNSQFELKGSFRNPYLKHCHEIVLDEGAVWVSSTGYDSVLRFDLTTQAFDRGNLFRGWDNSGPGAGSATEFDPAQPGGPTPLDSLHINNVRLEEGVLYVSGTGLTAMLRYDPEVGVTVCVPVPRKTHNCRFWRGGLLFNNTAQDEITYSNPAGEVLWRAPVPEVSAKLLLQSGLPQDHARARFARGLAVAGEDLIIGGYSPATIGVWRYPEPAPIRCVNITMDVREAIHGLTLWPFGFLTKTRQFHGGNRLRVIALLASYNEERFIGPCLENLERQGIETWLLDNNSTDRTVEIAGRFRGRGLLNIEQVARDGVFHLRQLMQRKEELARALDADWFLHLDADEIRLPPNSGQTLAEAFAAVDAQGDNAVNFQEFTFVPTRESPDHDHANFQQTMRWYYPFLPTMPHRLTAWKQQPTRVNLADSGGHVVAFPGLKMHPISFPMRHYFYLSIPHAIQKYIGRRFDTGELAEGWHRLRARLTPEMLGVLPSEKDLRVYTSDDALDATNPHQQNLMAQFWKSAIAPNG